MIRKRSVLQKLMLLKMASGGGGLTEYEVTGNPAAFSTNVSKPLTQMLIPFTPVQAEGTPSPENPLQITGWTGVNVTKTGSNLFDPALFGVGTKSLYNLSAGATLTTTGKGATISGTNPLTITNTTNWRGAVFFSTPLKAGVKYRLRYRISGSNMSNIKRTYYFVDGNNKIETNIANDTNVAQPESYVYNRLVTPTRDGQRFAFNVESSTAQTITINELRFNLEEWSEYEPYTGTTIPITFPDAVYGGILDVKTGSLAVDMGHIASYNGETIPGEWISDRDVYAPGTFPTIGAEVVYELAEPLEFQLTDINVPVTLIGDNVIFTDTNGQNTVKFLKRG